MEDPIAGVWPDLTLVDGQLYGPDDPPYPAEQHERRAWYRRRRDHASQYGFDGAQASWAAT